LWRWKRPLEISPGFALPLVKIAFDLVHENVSGPSVLNHRVGILEAFWLGIRLLPQGDVVIPGNLCKWCLHNCRVRPCLGESPHIFEIPGGKSGHVRVCTAKIGSQPVDHLGAPSLVFLPGQNIAADLPVKTDHLAVDGHGRPKLS
jgi:hypothetical protein